MYNYKQVIKGGDYNNKGSIATSYQYSASRSSQVFNPTLVDKLEVTGCKRALKYSGPVCRGTLVMDILVSRGYPPTCLVAPVS